MKRPRLAPRVKLHRNESTTVSGVSLRDLRDVLTAASLHFYETADKLKADGRDDAFNVAWLHRVHTIVKTLDAATVDRIHETHPWHNRPASIADRWRAVKADKAERLLIDKIIADAIANRAK